ncbi:MAG: hypothetical protein M1547_03060 [Gammaproteobacteria bacterium]|nr:hypothetical protein [Gammaproteobacteria bacterium]
MKDQTGLIRRGLIYYYRKRILTDPLTHYRKVEISISDFELDVAWFWSRAEKVAQ